MLNKPFQYSLIGLWILQHEASHHLPFHWQFNLAIKKVHCRNKLEEISYLNRLKNPEGFRKIADRLPYPLRLKWRELVDTITQKEARDPNLKDITDFVEARSRVTNHPIFTKVQGETSRSSNPKYNNQSKRDPRSFAVEGQPKPHYLPSSTPEKKVLKCPSCNKNHWLSQCSNFRKSRFSDKLKFVHVKKLCLNCLVLGHFVQDCAKQSFCHIEGCMKKHSTFLHEKEWIQEVTPSRPNQSNSAKSTETKATAMQVSNCYVQRGTFQASSISFIIWISIVPVKVKEKGQDKNVLTQAFLDFGSTLHSALMHYSENWCQGSENHPFTHYHVNDQWSNWMFSHQPRSFQSQQPQCNRPTHRSL